MSKTTKTETFEKTVYICDQCRGEIHDYQGKPDLDTLVFDPSVDHSADAEPEFHIHNFCKDKAIFDHLSGLTAKKEAS